MIAEELGILLVTALISGALMGYIFQRIVGANVIEAIRGDLQQKIHDLQKNQAVDHSKIEGLNQRLKQTGDEWSQAKSHNQKLIKALSEMTAKASSFKSRIHSLTKQEQNAEHHVVALEKEMRVQRDKTEAVVQQKSEVSEELAELKSTLHEREESFTREMQRFDNQKEDLKKDFENLANKVLDIKGKSFAEQSEKSLKDLLTPFREQVKTFQEKVEDIHHRDTKQQSELKSELVQLQKMNVQMSEEAHRLSTALQGQKKMQGNWGELVLENVLDRSGLQEGKDYKREVSFNTDEGRKRPDVIIYLPDNKHLVVDSKVSLVAYTQYVNADDDMERASALKQHVANVSARIKELSDKNYYELPGLKSPAMVFMFIPIESAFVEALKADESIFQKAIEDNVLVATPTTLLTSLKIVRQLWRFEDQNKHTAELAEKAGKVYDKLNSFIGSMESVGKALDRAKDFYDKAYGQLYSGKGNLIKQANEFKNLGVSVRAELPTDLTEKAELELTHQTELP